MNDRELLEAAAKAAGIEIGVWTTYGHYVGGLEGCVWNPLTDDGDALRLAVKLGIDIFSGAKMTATGTMSRTASGSPAIRCAGP